jgi:hypothetical protein
MQSFVDAALAIRLPSSVRKHIVIDAPRVRVRSLTSEQGPSTDAVNLPAARARLTALEHRSRAQSCALIYSTTDNGTRFP